MIEQPGNVLTVGCSIEVVLLVEMSDGKGEQAFADSLCQFLWTHTAHCRFSPAAATAICVAKYALYQKL